MAVGVLVVLFSIAGATIGMAEETLVFLPGLVLLAKRLGYDEVTAGAMALVGAGAGFSGAFLNPFTVGIAQGIAGQLDAARLAAVLNPDQPGQAAGLAATISSPVGIADDAVGERVDRAVRELPGQRLPIRQWPETTMCEAK